MGRYSPKSAAPNPAAVSSVVAPARPTKKLAAHAKQPTAMNASAQRRAEAPPANRERPGGGRRVRQGSSPGVSGYRRACSSRQLPGTGEPDELTEEAQPALDELPPHAHIAGPGQRGEAQESVESVAIKEVHRVKGAVGVVPLLVDVKQVPQSHVSHLDGVGPRAPVLEMQQPGGPGAHSRPRRRICKLNSRSSPLA